MSESQAPLPPPLEELYAAVDPENPSLTEEQYHLINTAMEASPTPDGVGLHDRGPEVEEGWRLRVDCADFLLRHAEATGRDPSPHLKQQVKVLSGLQMDQLIRVQDPSDLEFARRSVETARQLSGVITEHPELFSGYASTSLIVESVCWLSLVEKEKWEPQPYVDRIGEHLGGKGLRGEEITDKTSRELCQMGFNSIQSDSSIEDLERAVLLLEGVLILGVSKYDSRYDGMHDMTAEQRIKQSIERCRERIQAQTQEQANAAAV